MDKAIHGHGAAKEIPYPMKDFHDSAATEDTTSISCITVEGNRETDS